MQKAPLVSVIIPTFNRSTEVQEAIQSVRSGTFQDFELIVADDGSTDNTIELLMNQGLIPRVSALKSEVRVVGDKGSDCGTPTSERLFVLILPHSGYPGRVRNRASSIARGTYLAFLDSDDLWQPSKLETQVRAHKNAEREGLAYRLSHTRELWVRNGRPVSQRKQRHRRQGQLFADSLKKCILGPSTVLIERSLFTEYGGFREDLRIAEDYELWVRITAREPVLYVPEALTIKRGGRPDQLSQEFPFIEPFRLQALKDLVDDGFFDGQAHRLLALQEMVRKCCIHANGCRKRGNLPEALHWEALAKEYAAITDPKISQPLAPSCRTPGSPPPPV